MIQHAVHRLAHVDDVCLAVKHAEVQREHRDDEEQETTPQEIRLFHRRHHAIENRGRFGLTGFGL